MANQLLSNQSLAPTQSLVSTNGRYQFSYQTDGNLVLYKKYVNGTQKALWSSNTQGKPGKTCIMQTDGNLVIYNAAGQALWSSKTHGNPGSRLMIQDDGNAVIYRANNSASWATSTVQKPVPGGPVATGDDMQAGQVLNPNQSILSSNGRYRLLYQTDGNLVLYKLYPGSQIALWASNTAGKPGQVCIMQGDGNLVIYNGDAVALWSSNTQGNPGSRLVVQNDGNVVIYRPNNSAIWASRTQSLAIHFKSLLNVSATIQAYFLDQYQAMDRLFIAGNVNVDLATIEDLSGITTLQPLRNLNVGQCLMGQPTADHNALFQNRNNCGPNDIVVYLVNSLIGGAGNFLGCATHPNGRPGCAIVQSGARWLTAHEVGHVLNLRHVNNSPATNSDFLMWPNVSWTNVPPNVSAAEYKTMIDSGLTPVT